MSDNRIIECMERAQYLLGNLMAVKPGEEVLIVVDPQTDERMTQAMFAYMKRFNRALSFWSNSITFIFK